MRSEYKKYSPILFFIEVNLNEKSQVENICVVGLMNNFCQCVF